MFRNLHLRLAENVLEMTNAQWRLGKQVQNSQPRSIAKALVNLDQVHALTAARWRSTARIGFSHLTPLTFATLRSIRRQNQMQIGAFGFDIGDRILRNDTAVVLDTYIEVIGRKHPRPESKYFCQAV
jgi:hypothetical protein